MTRKRKSSRLWAFGPLAVLVFAVWQSAATVSRTPAFNRSLHAEAADGGRFPRFLPAMHSYPQYLYKVAYDWRNRSDPPLVVDATGEGTSGKGMFSRLRRMRDIVVEGLREDGANPAGQASARRARDIVTESLRVHPGNPSAWILLAQVNHTLGDPKAAVAAYLTAQILAPTTATVAMMRLGFLKTLLEAPGAQEIARTMIDPQLVQSDIEVVQSLINSDAVNARLSHSPAIRQFLDGQAVSN